MDWITQNLIWIVVGVLIFAVFWRRRVRPTPSDRGRRDAQDESNSRNDPVRGNRVDPTHAITAEYEGRTFFFESENSRAVFQQNPSRFAHQQHHHRHGCC
ncbi:YHS domain-containing protein [Burkholderia ubonensis]|uniref:YHS domain-containing protein n=1 Tax=Burkholderia ubonensis TaxID=101571 RepID=UPI000F58D4E8|nr:YHS domain-containing protein [Burkholderia ubonensis]RQP27757.1 YHS domain-containing protein [Burkholderia ubonensis]RQP29773.1 YHS domain-containing protein [Burkholderia ubonensis]RQP31929.1 YHS domain-containing protein [Burkholderia ubonensis]RQP47872.1 YHS domain-containing protein [Burkholderia ubonensis]RQP50889.1 YHS domain-containing protein [Burkholderia ubonensis]